MDDNWIQESPLKKEFGIKRTGLMSQHPGTYIESYHIDGLKVDFGHSTLEQWEEWVDPLIQENSSEPALLSMVGGFLESIPFSGEEIFRMWHDRLNGYSDEVALGVIKRNMGLYVPGYLLHQCLERNDMLAYFDGTAAMLKKILNITAAVNGVFYSAEEPRWVDRNLEKMELKAKELTGDNIRWMLTHPGEDAQKMLYRLLAETLDLVAKRFPDLKDRVRKKKKRLEEMRVEPCSRMPSIGS